MNNYKQNCTKGPVIVSGGRFEIRTEKDGELLLTADHHLMRKSRQEREANTSLVAEAFNVLAETGMTPRELADAVKELRKTMQELSNSAACCFDDLKRSGRIAQGNGADYRNAEYNAQLAFSKYQPVTPA